MILPVVLYDCQTWALKFKEGSESIRGQGVCGEGENFGLKSGSKAKTKKLDDWDFMNFVPSGRLPR
jgi:hypothetical protein